MRDWMLACDLWDVLARYNAEVARGLVHTEEWKARMADLQRKYDEHQRAGLIERGMSEAGDGVWMTATKPARWWRRLGRSSTTTRP